MVFDVFIFDVCNFGWKKKPKSKVISQFILSCTVVGMKIRVGFYFDKSRSMLLFSYQPPQNVLECQIKSSCFCYDTRLFFILLESHGDYVWCDFIYYLFFFVILFKWHSSLPQQYKKWYHNRIFWKIYSTSFFIAFCGFLLRSIEKKNW